MDLRRRRWSEGIPFPLNHLAGIFLVQIRQNMMMRPLSVDLSQLGDQQWRYHWTGPLTRWIHHRTPEKRVSLHQQRWSFHSYRTLCDQCSFHPNISRQARKGHYFQCRSQLRNRWMRQSRYPRGLYTIPVNVFGGVPTSIGPCHRAPLKSSVKGTLPVSRLWTFLEPGYDFPVFCL